MPRTWTEEEKAKFAADMKARKEAKQSTAENTLDLTEKTFNVESEFVRFILWEFDAGHKVDVIKITSHQALIVGDFTKKVPVSGYNSPFGSHRIVIVPQKEIDEKSK